MTDRIETFIQTVAKGVAQGTRQFIDNDLENYIPLFLFAAVLVIFAMIKRIIIKIRNKKEQ